MGQLLAPSQGYTGCWRCAVLLALVTSDSEDADRTALVSTASWGYLRLRRSNYDRAALASWAGEISARGWNDAFVSFKHEDEGAGPRMAAEFFPYDSRLRLGLDHEITGC